MSTLISWVVTPCGLVSRYRRFGRTWCLQPRWLTASKRRYLSISLQSVTPQKTSMHRNIPCRESNLGLESELPRFLGSEWNSLWCSCKAGVETVRHTPRSSSARSRHQISFKMKAVHKDTILSYEGPWKYTSEFRCVQVSRCLRCHEDRRSVGCLLLALLYRGCSGELKCSTHPASRVKFALTSLRNLTGHWIAQVSRHLGARGSRTPLRTERSRNTLFSYWISPASGSCNSSRVILVFHSISLSKLSTNV
jgi:hypothetical protein